MSEEKLFKSFKFHIPVELEKAKKADGTVDEEADSWKIKGIASTDDEDLQGEMLDQKGLDISVLKAGRGLFNYDHQKGPENVIGQIEDAEFTLRDNKKPALQVSGYLFKKQPRAQAFYNILSSVKKGTNHRVHMSVEGKILQRDLANNKFIRKARIEKVALTLDPVNPYTFVDLCKSLNDKELQPDTEDITKVTMTLQELKDLIMSTLDKAMSAGAGYTKAPSARAGGEAMSSESLEKEEKKITYDKKKKKKLTKSMVHLVIDNISKSYPEQDKVEIAKIVCETFKNKVNKGDLNV